MQPVIHMSLCILMLLVMFLRNGIRDPLFAVALFYFYFAFGPVINWLMGQGIYGGTIVGRIDEATLIFTLAMVGMFAVSMAWGVKSRRETEGAAPGRLAADPAKGLWLVYSALAIYGLGAMVSVFPEIFQADKIGRIALLGGKRHYSYLLVQAFAASTYFMVRKTRIVKRFYIANLGVYCLYCIVSQERDYVFLLTSLLLHSAIVTRLSFRRLVSVMVFVVIMAVGSVYVVALRDQTWRYTGLSSFLNQGSLLFINTQIVELVGSGYRLEMGDTYINSLLSLLPPWIYQGRYSLLAWFSDIYAPASRSGYGFALDAEAFLNFGYPGVAVFFVVIALFGRWVQRRRDDSHFWRYLGVFYTGFLMYSLRNDSLALLKGTAYAAAFYLLAAILAHVMERLEGR